MALLTQPAAAGSCARPADQAALEVRVLQTDLMVGALACAQAELYNGFVRKFRLELATQAHQLKSFFVRAYGQRAQHSLDVFITALANVASARTVADRAQSCSQSARLFDATRALGPKALALMAAIVPAASSHGFADCEPETRTVLGLPKHRPPRGEQAASNAAERPISARSVTPPS